MSVDTFVTNKLFRDYLFNVQALKDFFAWNPYHPEECRKALEVVKGYSYPRKKLVEILRRQNKTFGCGEKTLANIDLLSADATLAVITGQQAGLFTGPLLTIYKTLTTIKLAEQLQQNYEDKFVPVFWVVSDDHDFEEVNHIFCVSSDNDVIRVEYTPRGDFDRCPVKSIPIDEHFESVLQKLEGHLPETDFKASIVEMVKMAYTDSRSFADGFSRLLTRLFQDYGLVLVDPLDQELMELTATIFKGEIENPTGSSNRALQVSEQLKERGYPQQINLRAGHLNLFIEIEGRRCSVSMGSNDFQAEGRSFTAKDFLDILQSSPEKISPNVVLRPVVRSSILPTAAYIGGPAEISYYAQLKGVFEFFGVPMPIVYPRVRVTLIESKVRRILEKHSVTPEEVFQDAHGVIRNIIEKSLPDTFQIVFHESKSGIDELFGKIRESVLPIDNSLDGLITRSRNRLAHDVDKIEKKAIQAKKKSEETVVQQIHKVRAHLFPQGMQQERILNILPFLILYGPHFIERLYEAIDVNNKHHQIIDV
ncbi:MAG: bacillithiol biosynthesis cysteine-adding enzyme BshC [Gemmatimonadota bacterium]|nr:MAG: bacillithiol biosynthesis cysteine-adding enzyme BshC [Gemmatimonadota bacterium]